MSFICEHTGEVVGPGIPEHHVVVATREQRYENPFYRRGVIARGEPNITYGTETVKELRVSPDAYRKLTGLEPQVVPEKKRVIREKFTKPTRPKYKARPWKENKHKKSGTSTQVERKRPVVELVNKITIK